MCRYTHTHTHTYSISSNACACSCCSALACGMRITSSSTSPWSNRREREESANAKWGQGKRDGHDTTSCSSSLSLSASCRKYSRDLKRLRRRRRRRQRWLLFFYRQVACLVFCFGSTHSPICTYKQTYVRVCVVKGKSFCFCFPCSRRSRHCDQSGKICYMRFYRTSSLYSLPFVEGEPPVRLSVCVSQCVYTCVLFI